jgi:hypothetical protein
MPVGLLGVGHLEGDVAHAVAVQGDWCWAISLTRGQRGGEHEADAALLEHVGRAVAHPVSGPA